jgi:hypothetical protein
LYLCILIKNNSYANINISSSKDDEAGELEQFEEKESDDENGEDDEYGPRKLVKQDIKDIADMSDYEDGDEEVEQESYEIKNIY